MSKSTDAARLCLVLRAEQLCWNCRGGQGWTRAVLSISYQYKTWLKPFPPPYHHIPSHSLFFFPPPYLNMPALGDPPKHCPVGGPAQYHSSELQGPLPSAKQCMKPHSPEKTFPVTKALSWLCTVPLSNGEIYPDLTPRDMGVLLSLVMNHPGEIAAGHPT